MDKKDGGRRIGLDEMKRVFRHIDREDKRSYEGRTWFVRVTGWYTGTVTRVTSMLARF